MTRLVGFALDVSGSMEGSIQNVSGGAENRLDSIRRALDTLLAEAGRLAASAPNAASDESIEFFAYAFGLQIPDAPYGDLFCLLDSKEDFVDREEAERLRARYEERLRVDERGVAIELMGFEARRLLQMSRAKAENEVREAIEKKISVQVVNTRAAAEAARKDLTLNLGELTERWSTLRENVSMSNDFLGGATPMRAALEEVAQRFVREQESHLDADCTLFVVSDGDSTDGDPRKPGRRLAARGVKIISCFVSSRDVVDARRLYSKPGRHWPDGARAMFDIASVLPEASPEAEYLARTGWDIGSDSRRFWQIGKSRVRMFAQINQSELLSEFINVIVAPIEAEHGRRD